jgi:AcrR family transcriptional regulator
VSTVKEEKIGHRQRHAQATRELVARAARALFAERGYVATTIQAISAAADIPAQTIYSAFGTKAKILEAIRREWIAQSRVQELHDEAVEQSDPVRRIRMMAMMHRQQMETGYDVIAIYSEAARVDADMNTEWRAVLADRERAIGKLIDSFAGQLRSGIDRQRAIDIYIACTHNEVYASLVLEHLWGLDDFENWTGDLLVTQLLPGPADRKRGNDEDRVDQG